MAIPELTSRRLRRIVDTALQALASDGVVLASPGDWSTPSSKLPEVKYRFPRSSSTGTTNGQAHFASIITLQIEAKVSAITAEAAQDAIEDLCARIQWLLVSSHALLAEINKIASYDVGTDFSSDGNLHLAQARIGIDFDVPEFFDLTAAAAPAELQELQLTLDAAAPFDATGTYTGGSFPESVTPAPRESGPDGRAEGGLSITFPQ